MTLSPENERRLIEEHLRHIVATHNPNDPCQAIVRKTALQVLAGQKQISFEGAMFLTNGARGYDMSISFPNDWEKTREEILVSLKMPDKI